VTGPTPNLEAETSRLRDSLRAAIGPGVLLDSTDEIAPLLTDYRGLFRGRALAVAWPRNVDEVSRLLVWCSAEGVAVVPQGGNTSYCGGATPDASGRQLLIGLRRLNRVRHVDPDNYAITVEAGCTLAEVQRAAAAAQRYFPLQLGSAESCQIGGNLATNAGGLNVLRYGMARALTLGVEVVLADGRVLQHLRALQKDNTGYDLSGLFVGSEGTLGIITSATLKLWPQLRSTSTALVAVPEVAAAVSLLAVLRETAGERINSFELLPRAAMELTQRHIEGIQDPLSSAHPWYVLCELSSTNIESLDGLLEQGLTQASAAGLVSDAVICANERQRSLLWRLRENIPEAQRRAGPSLKHDIALPLGKLAEFVAQAASWVRASVPDATLIAYGHAGDGNLHFNLSFPREATAASVAALEPTVRRAIHDLVASHGGSFSAEHGIGQLKTGELQRYTSAVELNLMREIKRALDPHGIMNPGKVLTTC